MFWKGHPDLAISEDRHETIHSSVAWSIFPSPLRRHKNELKPGFLRWAQSLQRREGQNKESVDFLAWRCQHAECFLGRIMNSLAEVGVDNMIVLCRSCHPRTKKT